MFEFHFESFSIFAIKANNWSMLAGTMISFSTFITAIYPLFKFLCIHLGNHHVLNDWQHRPEVYVTSFGRIHSDCDKSSSRLDLLVVGVRWDLVVPVYC